jgi:hypothetical protein
VHATSSPQKEAGTGAHVHLHGVDEVAAQRHRSRLSDLGRSIGWDRGDTAKRFQYSCRREAAPEHPVQHCCANPKCELRGKQHTSGLQDAGWLDRDYIEGPEFEYVSGT